MYDINPEAVKKNAVSIGLIANAIKLISPNILNIMGTHVTLDFSNNESKLLLILKLRWIVK